MMAQAKRPVTLLDGTETDTWSDGWRAECKVRDAHVNRVLSLLGRHNRERRDAYYASVGKMEGAEAEARLRARIAVLWKAEKERMK